MKTLSAIRASVDPKALRLRAAQDSDYDALVTESTRVYDDSGVLRVVYEVLDRPPEDLISAFKSIEYNKSARTGGLMSQARVLGYLGRITIRNDYCRASDMADKHPREHAVFCNYARKATKIYSQWAPQQYAEQELLLAAKVKPAWRIPEASFTSGIVNWDNPLHYHTDSGNFPDTWNAMYATAFDCAGGHLVVPELRLAFSFHKPAFVIFEAQKFLHGVTPLQKRSSMAYRYSVVYYALQSLCQCLKTPAEELERCQKVRTQRELKRAGLIKRDPKEEADFQARAARGRKSLAERK
jgi:hypothetical protein